MKKVVAIGLCIAMCAMMILCVVPAAVSANTSITVSGTYDNGVLTVSWNETLPEGYSLTKVKVGSVTKNVSFTGNKADISINLRPGKYEDAECIFTGSGDAITSKFSLTIPTGSVAIKTFEIEQYPSGSRKGRIKIRDEFDQIPVGLKLNISGFEGSPIEVGKENYTSFDIPEGMDSIKLVAESQTINYEGYRILFESESSNTLKIKLSPEEQLGFKFNENHRSFDADAGTLQVTWNAGSANGTDVVAVVVNGKTYSVVSDYNGGFTADLSSLAPGHYDMSYVFRKSSGTEVTLSVDSLERGGELATELSVKVENGKITATLTDKSLKRPVANADVKLRIGQTDFPARKTDKNGKVVFNNAPPTDVSTVLCIFTGMTDGAILYSGCTGSMTGIVTIPPTPTTTGSSSNTTRPPTTSRPTKRPDPSSSDPTATSGTTETQPSYAVIAGAGTTSVVNDKIGVNVTYDQGILDQFSMSEAEFNSRALLLIPKDFYSSLAGSKSTVMLSARYSPIKVTSQQISSAVSNISKFSKYDAARVLTVTMDMGLLIGDTQTAIPFSSDEYQLQVRLPVPTGMKDCDVLAVAYTNETSLGSPTEVKVKDGYLEFAVQQLGTFTILGFSKDSSNGGGGIPTLILVLLIVGLLMLVGAGLLIYFFVIRKPKDDDDDDFPPDGGGELPGGPNGSGPDSPMPIVPDGYEPILPIPDAENGTAGSIPVDPRMDTVPLSGQTPDAESRDIFSSDSRDIYSSASRQPAPAPRTRAEDVTLGAYRTSKGAEHAAPKKRTKKDPSDYDIKF